MNKIFKYSLALLTMVVGFTACSDSDDNYQPASVSGYQVFFSNTLQSQYEISTSATSFTVPISRGIAAGAITVPLTVTQSEGSIFTVPTSVSFNDGESTAYLTITYDPANIVYGKYDEITISIADANLATAYGLSSYTFKAGITEWVKMKGNGTFRDDLLAGIFSVDNYTWDVTIYESVVAPGRYKVEAPYGINNGFRNLPFWDDAEEILNYYKPAAEDLVDMIIDATDPQHVWFQDFETGLDGLGGIGKLGLASRVYYWMQSASFADVVAKYPAFFGQLVDGVITFENTDSQGLIWTQNGEWWNYFNTNGKFAIALPGYTFADYSAAVEFGGIFTNTANEAFAVVNATLGPDATDVKGVVIEADADDDAVADAVAAGELEAVDIVAGSNQVPIPADLSGNLKVVIVVLKGTEAKNVASVNFEYYGGGANPWHSIGTGYLTDDFVWSYFLDEEEQPKTIEVEILTNDENPGIYRLKEPYAGIAADWNETFGDGDGKKDIEINAVDPEGVYILNQLLGLEFSTYGEISLETRAGYWVSVNGFDAVKAEHPDWFGKLADGVITFPSFETTGKDGEGNTYNYIFQGYINLPNGNGWNVGRNGAMKLELPTASAAVKTQAKKRAQATNFARRMNAYNFKPVKLNKKVSIINKKNIKAKVATLQKL